MCLSNISYYPFHMKPTHLLLFFSILLISCEGESEEQVNTLGSDVSISLAEYLEPQERTLTFKFLTEKDFPCINYQISHAVQRMGNTISIELTGVEKADVCLDAIGPASAFIDVGNLSEGDYELIIKVGHELVNQGTLKVTSQAYHLTMEQPEGLLLENTDLLRIPDNTIWGTLKYEPEQKNKGVYQTLLSNLEAVGATEKRLDEGDYYYFDVDAAGRIQQRNNTADLWEEALLLEFNGSNDQITQVLQQMKQTFNDQISIRLYNAKGEEFKSWSQH